MSDRHAMLVRERDRIGTRKRRFAQRRAHRQRRIKRAYTQLDAHLIVALTRAPVRDGGRMMCMRGFDEQRRDERTRERSRERIDALILCVGMQRRKREIGDEAFACIDDDRVSGAKRERLRTCLLEFGFRITRRRRRPKRGRRVALAEVGGHRDDLMPGEDEFLEQHGGVESAGIGEDDAAHTALFPFKSRNRCLTTGISCGSRTMTTIVSSPPSVPITSGHAASSTAEATIIALPGGVRMTMRFTLPSTLVTNSATNRCRRLT